MKLHRRSSLLLFLLLSNFLLMVFSTTPAFSQDCETWIAKAVSVQGEVWVEKGGNPPKLPVTLNKTYDVGDKIYVGKKSRLGISLCNESMLRLDQNTTLTFTGIEKKRVTVLDMVKGVIHFFSRTPRGLKVATPFVNGAVEGTEFLVKVDIEQQETFMSIFEGRVLAEGIPEAKNAGQSLLLASGESAVTRFGQAPQLVTVVRPRDAVQWAMHYPPVLSYRAKDFPGTTGWEKKVHQSIKLY
jgi:hypothetical protein